MKGKTAFLKIALYLSLLISGCGKRTFDGAWEGVVGDEAIPSRLVLTISKSSDAAFRATLVKTDEGESQRPLQFLAVKENSFHAEDKESGAVLDLRLNWIGTQLVGTYIIHAKAFALKMARGSVQLQSAGGKSKAVAPQMLLMGDDRLTGCGRFRQARCPFRLPSGTTQTRTDGDHWPAGLRTGRRGPGAPRPAQSVTTRWTGPRPRT